MKILIKQQIEQVLSIPEVLNAIEHGFAEYSQGEIIVPPVASLHFTSPPGDCHIKYGYAKSGKYYVVKIASGFPNNFMNSLPSGNGLMLLFDKNTGTLVSILHDEGFLTDIRTAAAGCITAKYLAPKKISCIGIIGTGAQSFHQLKMLTYATQCRKAFVWGRDDAKALKLKHHSDLKEWNIEVAKNIDQVAIECNLIITTTSSKTPLLYAKQIQPGTHITAVGADDIGKQEIDPEIFANADKVIVDSRSQCMQFGDASYAIKNGMISSNKLIELGEIVLNPTLGRTSENQITVADLTGIAVQDLQIATTIFEADAKKGFKKFVMPRF